MELNNVNLIVIGVDDDVLTKQVTLLSDLVTRKNKVLCKAAIVEAISQNIHDEYSIVVVNLTNNALQELAYLEALGEKKSSMIIIGDQSNVDLLTHALRAGVKDFIDEKHYQDRLVDVFNNIKKTITQSHKPHNENRLNVFINAKGGSGSSFIASNVAYILSREAQLRVALVDLDLQFGTIGLNFDQMPKYTLTQAVNAVDELDIVSLEAYLLKYDDSLSLLLPSPTEILLPGELNISKLKKLLDLLKLNFNQIVVDLPRLIDPLSSLVMDQADQITLVIQQNLAQFRDGRRLIQVLNKELDIPLEKIVIVINRFDPKNSLRIEDLKSLVNHDNVFTIVNDFDRVESAANVGVPLCETSENSEIAHDLRILAKVVGQIEFEPKKKSFFSFLGF